MDVWDLTLSRILPTGALNWTKLKKEAKHEKERLDTIICTCFKTKDDCNYYTEELYTRICFLYFIDLNFQIW